MTAKQVRQVDAREGYDHWSESYDETPNPVVAMDARHAIRLLAPQRGERIADAGCGTGRNFPALRQAGCSVVGLDDSAGMLRVARRRHPAIMVARASLEYPLPCRASLFDAVLCSLVGEHINTPLSVFVEFLRILKPGGRLLFSVYHPEMAAAGIQANFVKDDTEFRLGAYRHTREDYMGSLIRAGFEQIDTHEFRGDDALAETIPGAQKYIDFPILLILQGKKPEPQTKY